MIVAEDWENGSDFTIELPTEFGYFERSWIAYDEWSMHFKVDGVEQSSDETNVGGYMHYGTLGAAQLLPDEPHEIRIDDGYNAYGALVVIYSQS